MSCRYIFDPRMPIGSPDPALVQRLRAKKSAVKAQSPSDIQVSSKPGVATGYPDHTAKPAPLSQGLNCSGSKMSSAKLTAKPTPLSQGLNCSGLKPSSVSIEQPPFRRRLVSHTRRSVARAFTRFAISLGGIILLSQSAFAVNWEATEFEDQEGPFLGYSHRDLCPPARGYVYRQEDIQLIQDGAKIWYYIALNDLDHRRWNVLCCFDLDAGIEQYFQFNDETGPTYADVLNQAPPVLQTDADQPVVLVEILETCAIRKSGSLEADARQRCANEGLFHTWQRRRRLSDLEKRFSLEKLGKM